MGVIFVYAYSLFVLNSRDIRGLYFSNFRIGEEEKGRCVIIDDQKNSILALLCLASYLAANWLQKLEMKHCAYYAEVELDDWGEHDKTTDGGN